MHRAILVLSILLVTVISPVARDCVPHAMAQVVTWAPAQTEDGVTFEPIAFGPAFDLSVPVSVSVARVTVEPGSAFSITADEPTAGILLVESGSFTIRIDAEISVSRGAEAGGATRPARETIAAGKDIRLDPGDAAYIPVRVEGEVRNAGLTPAVALAILAGSQEAM